MAWWTKENSKRVHDGINVSDMSFCHRINLVTQNNNTRSEADDQGQKEKDTITPVHPQQNMLRARANGKERTDRSIRDKRGSPLLCNSDI